MASVRQRAAPIGRHPEFQQRFWALRASQGVAPHRSGIAVVLTLLLLAVLVLARAGSWLLSG